MAVVHPGILWLKCMYVCIYVCMYVYIYIYIYIYICVCVCVYIALYCIASEWCLCLKIYSYNSKNRIKYNSTIL